MVNENLSFVVVADYAFTVLLTKKNPRVFRFFWLCFLMGYICNLQIFLPLKALVNKLWVTKKSKL